MTHHHLITTCFITNDDNPARRYLGTEIPTKKFLKDLPTVKAASQWHSYLFLFPFASWKQQCTTGRMIMKSVALVYGQSTWLLCFWEMFFESLHGGGWWW